jgi:enediyne biosynthesis protein E4
LLRNVSDDHHHWVELKLVGGPKAPRDAVGSTVYLAAGGMKQRGDVLSGGSFASSNDQRVHFGIGDATAVDSVEIHWPGSIIKPVKLPGVDCIYTVEQGKGVTGQICGKSSANAKAPDSPRTSGSTSK